ncbi:MAG: AAA family ATPase [Bacteroidales bacterium]|nr:AAA family ATPase [Candidatus Sodaliphilus limicaballi]
MHKSVSYSPEFVYDQLAFLDYYFKEDGVSVAQKTQTWNARKDVPKKNGEIDNRFYFNGLLEEVEYVNSKGEHVSSKFTIRNFLAGGYSDLHIKKTDDGIFDVWITNVQQPYFDDKEDSVEIIAPPLSSGSSLQQIYYGAPGTGKSHSINEQTEGESVIRTTFHPDSDYSTFVGAYKPTTKQITLRDMSGHPILEDGVVLKEDRIVYEFVDQAFLQAYVKAWKFFAENNDATQNQYLIIEEINRGNCAQIFGDLFQLLDRNEWGFSDYPINADKDMKKQLKKAFTGLEIKNKQSINGHYKGRDVVKEVLEGDILLLPSNLYIWATMNTSDQSLFPIDSAFKRRWDWQYMPIAQGRDEAGKELAWIIDVNGSKYSWWSFLEKINAQIGEATQSEDKKLGFFFCKAKDGVITPETFVGKVVFYLWNDVFKDYGFEGSIFKDKDGTELSFNKFYAADLKGNAVVQKDKVELFLNNLGVELVEEGFDVDNEDGEEYEEDEARVSDTNAPYRVTFPDGEIICEDSGWETYVASLQKIGLEKALPFGEMYSRLNKTLPLITKKKIADQGVYKYYEVDGYYILSGTDSQHRLLKRMNKDLNLGLKIE